MKYVLTSHMPDEEAEIVSEPMDLKDGKRVLTSTVECPTAEFEGALEVLEEGENLEVRVGDQEVITLRPALPDDLLELDIEGFEVGIDAIIYEYPEERFRIAFDRATKEFGGLVADHEDEDFVEEFNRQLKLMAAQDLADSLVDQGDIVPNGSTEEGLAIYQAA